MEPQPLRDFDMKYVHAPISNENIVLQKILSNKAMRNTYKEKPKIQKR